MNRSFWFVVQIVVVFCLGSVLCQSKRTGAVNESNPLHFPSNLFNETVLNETLSNLTAAVAKISNAFGKLRHVLHSINSTLIHVINATTNGSADDLMLIKNYSTGMDSILLKMDAKFTFNSDGKSAELPDASDVTFEGPIAYTGYCDDPALPCAIAVMFADHSLVKFIIDKNMTTKMWYVKTIHFVYHLGTGPDLEKRKSLVASSKPNDIVIEAPFGKSYQCSYPFTVKLYVENSPVYVYAVFENIQIQGYANTTGKFGPEFQCSYISDTVPIAVGCTLAIITILIVGAYGIYRSLFVKKVDYDTMED